MQSCCATTPLRSAPPVRITPVMSCALAPAALSLCGLLLQAFSPCPPLGVGSKTGLVMRRPSAFCCVVAARFVCLWCGRYAVCLFAVWCGKPRRCLMRGKLRYPHTPRPCAVVLRTTALCFIAPPTLAGQPVRGRAAPLLPRPVCPASRPPQWDSHTSSRGWCGGSRCLLQSVAPCSPRQG
jgi:hypothetical protein